MKRALFILFFFLITINSLQAQEKRVESNIQLSQGLFFESGSGRILWSLKNPSKWTALYYLTSSSTRLSYGLDIRLGGPWSLMPGLGLRNDIESLMLIGAIGGDIDLLLSADAFCSLRYHLDAGKVGIVFGLGPDVSYIIDQSGYYLDAYPDDPLNGKDKFYRFDYAVQPSITFRAGKHWQWGLEATIGLRNMRIPYPQYPDSPVGSPHRFDRFSLTCGFHF